MTAHGTNGAPKRLKHNLRASDDDARGHVIGTCRVCKRAGVYATASCPGKDAPPPPQAPALAVVGSDVAQPPPDVVTPFVDEIGHAVIQLGLLERRLGEPVVIVLPDGRNKRLGDLLMELGDYVYKHEQPKPRILSPGMWRP